MNKHQARIEEVRGHFQNGDIAIGFRRLLDVAMDTQNMDIYQQCIAFTDWKSQHEDDTEGICNQAFQLLETIAQCPVKAVSTENPVIEAKNIIKSYGLKAFSMGPVSLSIKKGEVYGLVGENGNGKTTLLRILAQELSYDAGSIRYRFEQEPTSEYELRTKLAYIPQRTQKWYGSLLDNLRFVLANYGTPPQEIEPRVLMMVARLGLWQYKHLEWNALSSGYKMRFELARTLLRKPELLLLDEPLANLDILAQQIILEDLKSIVQSLTQPAALIFSSQQLYEVEKISNQVIFLKKGRYQDLNPRSDTPNEAEIPPALVVELEVNNTKEALLRTFADMPAMKITDNGGMFVLEIEDGTTFHQLLAKLASSTLSIVYVRDISRSTRRFFIN
ncbi:ATP-binding cassette domain-containing protein [Riemerella columbina]|uniref:ATP-binding cassette domain-containing protein n=1 Tax=Riemerella columbina TaxID=103810 RepID=UPI0026703809|nr:ATP-binding cassette domain-containing protein [Riemerella columbina]WKS95452.1 ATP-binding cassette domain-containing protein [Riemerella columbina]